MYPTLKEDQRLVLDRTFRITGEFKAVHNFLDSLKVYKEFLE